MNCFTLNNFATFNLLTLLDVKFLFFTAFNQRKQFCTPRAGNPGNVLLTSKNPPMYFYQCSPVNSAKLSCSSEVTLRQSKFVLLKKTFGKIYTVG